jgi:steroid delta-isomerase
MSRDDMLRHAAHWIDAWNGRDVDAVLSAFRDDARFVSPKASHFVGRAELADKREIEAYWRTALNKIDSLIFTLDHVTCDVDRREMIVVYVAELNGRRMRASELMRFDHAGL